MYYIKLALTVTLSIFLINTSYVYSKSLLPKGIKRSETVIWGTRHSKKIADNKNFNICKKHICHQVAVRYILQPCGILT